MPAAWSAVTIMSYPVSIFHKYFANQVTMACFKVPDCVMLYLIIRIFKKCQKNPQVFLLGSPMSSTCLAQPDFETPFFKIIAYYGFRN